MTTTLLTHVAKNRLLAIAGEAKNRGKETHAYVLGHHNKDGVGVITRVERIGNPTEHAMMTKPDLSAAGQALYPLVKKGYRLLGEAHRHAGLIGPSAGDEATLRSLNPELYTGYRCMVVTTFDDDREPVIKCIALLRDGTTTQHELQETDENDPFEYQPYLPTTIGEQTVTQFGLGSGGGLVALQLAKLGLKHLVIIDPDTVEERNLARHVLGKRAVKQNKARAMRDLLRERTTTKVHAFDITVSPGMRERLVPLILESDLIVNCMGHPVATSILSSVAREHQVKVVHAGVYTQGAGGFVFYQDPRTDEPCYDCIFHHTRRAAPDNNASIDALTTHYGFTTEQLDRQLGLFADVNVIASMQAKIAMEALKGQRFEKNLWLIDNHHLGLNATLVRQDAACVTCNPL